MGIRYLNNNEINRNKWDEAISVSFNGNVYAYSWFLDEACYTWDALVEDDYDRVMPLPICKKMGIQVIYMPELIENLGVFSTTKLNDTVVTNFINKIPLEFKYVMLRLNKYCSVETDNFETKWIQKKKIDLISDYEKIKQNTNKRLLEKVTLAEQRGFTFSETIKPIEYFEFLRNNKPPFRHKKSETRFEKIVTETFKRGAASMWGIYNPKGVLCTASLIHNKLHNSIVPSHNSIVLMIHSNKQCAEEEMEEILIFNYVKKNSSTSSTLEVNRIISNSELLVARNFISNNSDYIELVRTPKNFIARNSYNLLFKNDIKQ